jgi:hypothetical protein
MGQKIIKNSQNKCKEISKESEENYKSSPVQKLKICTISNKERKVKNKHEIPIGHCYQSNNSHALFSKPGDRADLIVNFSYVNTFTNDY